ncbi:MAG: DUF11 domain-containing protein [Ilumatobacter sp.]|nr:DUF11 domain-containing protein [Ilumatobacter sp.]
MERRGSRALVLVVALLASLVPITTSSGTASAAAELVLQKSAPGSILAGDRVTYALTASNPGDAPQYNLSFRDVLAPGVTYVPGSTMPDTAQEPTIVVNEVEFPPASGEFVPQQTLIWRNVGDVQAADQFELTFDVTLNETPSLDHPTLPVYVVGSSVDNTGEAFASPDPRELVQFDSEGVPLPDAAIDVAASATVTTSLSAISLTKREPSPEGELLRGVHDHVTEYSLEVRVTEQGDVDTVIVTDYLPAELEFLGCNDTDNSSAAEFPGAPALGAGPAVVGCTPPDTVETVVDPPADVDTTYPSGTYTKLTWNLGDLAAGSDVTLRYTAGIPLRANVAFGAPAPDPSSGLQGANLDNNTGPSTRELAGEGSITNTARAAGSYQGPVEPGSPAEVSDDDEVTLSIEDVRMRKAVSPGQFEAGGRARYTVTIDTSEYTSASSIALADVVPNGICPLAPGSNFAEPIPPSPTPPGECDGTVADQPTVVVDGGVTTPISIDATENSTSGGFDLSFSGVPDLARNSTAVLTYFGRMRTTYSFGTPDGAPPVSGDGFTNSIDLTATTTPLAGTGEAGDVTVGDDSSATQSTTQLSIDKTVYPRTLLQPGDPCPDSGYIEPNDPGTDPADLEYRLGDRICFRLRVDFSSTVYTRNAVVTDFLPVGVEYIAGSAFATPANSVTLSLNESQAASGAEPPTWTVGDLDGANRFVDPGGVFDVVLAGRVVELPTGVVPDILDNLMKLRTENTAGQARSYRDSAPFAIVPAPPISILKGVAEVDDPAFSTALPDQDGITVQQDSLVTYRVDLTNDGSDSTSNGYSIRGLEVWDALPLGIECADVSNITNLSGDTGGGPSLGECTDPGDPGHPTFDEQATRSAIRWQFPVDEADVPGGVDRWAIFDGETRTLTYQVRVPTPTSFGVDLVNDASVRSYQAFSNDFGAGATYYPTDNVDTSVPAANWNAPVATDPSNIVTPGASVDKTGTTSITEAGNNAPNQVVPGELVTYTYAVDIPADTSVFEGSLSDAVLPNNRLTVLASPAPVWRFYPDSSSSTTAAQPGGFALSAGGTLTFPPTYTNDTSTEQRFEVEIVARVRNDFTQQGNVVNTATFSSLDRVGGAPLPNLTDNYTVTVRQLAPTFAKSSDESIVVGDQVVTYTLTASNPNNRPALHDAWITDCLPAGLTFESFGLGSGTTLGPFPGGTSQSDGTTAFTNSCPSGTTFIAFGLDTLATGTTQTRTYEARVDITAVAGDVYTNGATLTGGTLDDGATNPNVTPNPNERTVSRTDDVDITVPAAGETKTASPDRATIGQTVSYTFTATVPPNTNFYQSAALDILPPGLDPATFTFLGSDCDRLTTPTTTCDLTATLMPNTVTDGDGNLLVGFLIGDVAGDPFQRVITVRYSAKVADVPANTAGAIVRNEALTAWDMVDTADVPDTPEYPWENRDEVTQTADVTVLEPDVSIDKSVSDTTPEPGEVFTYTIDLINSAASTSSPAHDLVVIDAVPVGVRVDPLSFTPTPASFVPSTSSAPGEIRWELPGPIPVDGTLTISYNAELAPSAEIDDTPQVNTADVDSYASLATGSPGRRTYDGGSDTATVTPQFPDLTVDKSTVSATPAYLGSPFTWRIEVTNDGGGSAFAVAVTDLLPTNWTYVTGSADIEFPGGGVLEIEPVITELAAAPGLEQQLEWEALGELEPGESLIVTFDAVATNDAITDPGIGSSIAQQNDADTVAVDRDGATGNLDGPYADADDASTRIDATDLSIDKFHGAAPVAGRNFDWTVRVTNRSTTDTAVGPFTVTDTLPTTSGVTYVSATGSGWSCGQTAGAVTCTRSGSLAPGASFPTITVRMAVGSAVTQGTIITNDAVVGGRTYDVDLDNNNDTDAATVTTSADLAVAKTLTSTLVAGEPATYSVAVTNLGPSVSRADGTDPITVTDTLPPGTTFVSAVGTGWTCTHDASPTGGDVTCDRPADLPVGPAPAITVTVSVPSNATGAIVNTATVAPGTTTDPVPGNNTDDDTTTVDADADLGIVKTALGPYVAGEPTVYRFEVTNSGPSDAEAVVRIDDTLPAGLTYVGSTDVTGTWTCAGGATGFVCDLAGTLPFGDTVVVEVVADVDPDVLGEVTNTATVESGTDDPNPDNDTDDAPATFVGVADLQIVKSLSGELVAGATATYEVVVTNLGPSVSRSPITVVDTLPDQTTFVSATGTGWTCTHDGSPSGGDITCDYAADLPFGAPIPAITVQADLASDTLDEVVNTAEITETTTTDPNPDNDTDDDRTTPTTSADLRLDKSSTGPLVPGEQLTYRLRVDNEGPSDAAATVTITDALPAGLTYASSTSIARSWTCSTTAPDATAFECELAGTLPAGSFATVDVVVDVDPGVLGDVINTATVTSPTDDPNLDDNTDDDDTASDTAADLSIVKSSTGTAVAGESLTWELDVSNLGPSDSQPDIVVTDVLPAGVAFQSATGTDWTCAHDGSPTAGTVICTRATSLGADTDAPTISVIVDVLPDAGPATLSNTASVSGATDDPDPSNDSDGDDVVVTDEVDLSIVKTVTPNPVRAGEQVTYTLTVANDGPSVADDVAVTDALPSGLTVVSVDGTADGWSCTSPSPTQIECGRATLDPTGGTPTTITVVAEVASGVADGTVLVNTAAVATSSPETDLDDNTSSVDLDVVAEADLSVVKTHTAPDVLAGGQLTFDFAVANDGPSNAAADVRVVDTLPDGFTYVSSSGPWTCTAGVGTIDCTYDGGIIVADTSAPGFSVTVDVAPSLDAGIVTNTATVSSPTTDPEPDDDTDTDDVTIVREADLSIAKTHDADDVRIGDDLEFELVVTNVGPSDARDVVVTDDLPLGLTAVAAAGDGWTCGAVGPTVTCALATPLAPATAAPPIVVTATVEPEAFPSVVNAASVATSTTDPNPDDNATTDDVDVPRLVDLTIVKTHEGEVRVGGTVDFVLTVGNDGPIDDDATITVVDTLPAGLTPSAATSDDADCSIDLQTVTCTLVGGLAVGETFSITVTADVGPAAFPTVANTATVGSPTDDADPTDNTSTDEVEVPALVDLSIVKTHIGQITVGNNVDYRLVVTNHGPTPDPGPVTIIDTLPTSLLPTGATGEGVTCAIADRTVTCTTIDPLAVDASITVVVTAEVAPSAYPEVTNTANVTTPSEDVDETNDSDDDVASVIPSIELDAAKRVVSQNGTTVVWGISATNNGLNATVEPIVVDDPLASGLQLVSVAGDGWTCAGGTAVQCRFDAEVPAGGSTSELLVTTRLVGSPGSTVTNVATVVGGGSSDGPIEVDASVVTPGRIPATGSTVWSIVRTGGWLALLGAALWLVARRRNWRWG